MIKVVPLERIKRLAGLLPRDEPAPRKKASGIALASWLAGHGIAVQGRRPWHGGTIYVLEECPFSSAPSLPAVTTQVAAEGNSGGRNSGRCMNRGGPGRRLQGQRRRTPLLRDGDPLAFILDIFNKSHAGDRTVAECLAMPVASQSVENTNGLHVSISGNSGKGKTHACTTMQNLIPDAYKLKGPSPTKRSTTTTTSRSLTTCRRS